MSGQIFCCLLRFRFQYGKCEKILGALQHSKGVQSLGTVVLTWLSSLFTFLCWLFALLCALCVVYLCPMFARC